MKAESDTNATTMNDTPKITSASETDKRVSPGFLRFPGDGAGGGAVSCATPATLSRTKPLGKNTRNFAVNVLVPELRILRKLAFEADQALGDFLRDLWVGARRLPETACKEIESIRLAHRAERAGIELLAA